MRTKEPTSEKADLIRDIRSRLPFVAIGHPDIAAEIAKAMDALEEADAIRARVADLYSPRLLGVADPTSTELRVGTVVRVFDREPSRLGIIVQVGDAEDGHEGAVLVHMADGPGYPCWWANFVVVPVARLA